MAGTMLDADSKPSDADLHPVPFWPVVAQSRIPMALVNRDRRYVELNDAAIRVFQYQRAEVLGRRIGRTSIIDPATADAQWEQLARTDELLRRAHRRARQWDANARQLRRPCHDSGRSLAGAIHDALPVSIPRPRPDRRRRSQLRTVPIEAHARSIRCCGWSRSASIRAMSLPTSTSPRTVRTHVRNAMAGPRARARPPRRPRPRHELIEDWRRGGDGGQRGGARSTLHDRPRLDRAAIRAAGTCEAARSRSRGRRPRLGSRRRAPPLSRRTSRQSSASCRPARALWLRLGGASWRRG